MDDDSDRSSETTQLEENSTPEDAKNLDDDDAEDSAALYEKTDQRDVSPLQISHVSAEEDSRTCRSLTLVSDLSEVPVKYEMRRDELEHLKNQLQGSHQEALATVIAQAAQAHSESQLKLPGVLSSSTGLPTMPVMPILSLPSVPVLSSLQGSNSQGQIVSPVVNAGSIHVAEADQKDTTDPKSLSVSHPVKIPMDDYSWRKYGQKQVKSPEGSRSYYKCTYIECDAKKIESCDQFNSVTKIVYRGQHKHDPPKKVSSRGGKILSTPKSPKRKSISTPGLKEHRSSDSVGCVQVEQMDESQQKQRVKKSSSESPGSALKHPKKPKFIVHAAGDVEISADGYRWRKYGQKMVKGNPHPRNYYKCTSAGCLMRKHIEKAVDGASGVIITYKGVHDHDMPVPKKRQPPPTTHLITAASNRTESTTETAAKTSETARTLLSVGFEIKNC